MGIDKRGELDLARALLRALPRLFVFNYSPQIDADFDGIGRDVDGRIQLVPISQSQREVSVFVAEKIPVTCIDVLAVIENLHAKESVSLDCQIRRPARILQRPLAEIK